MGRGVDRELLPGLLRGRRWRRWAFWTLAIVLWAWFLLGEEGLLRQVARWREVRALEARLAEVRARNDSLREEIRSLREDDLAIEAAVRRELDWQRPGERVFVLPEEDPLTRSSDRTDPEVDTGEGPP